MLPDLSRLTTVADEVAQNVASLTDRFDRAFGQETADQITQAIDNMEEFTATLRRLADEQSDQFLGIAEDVQNATSEIASVLATARGSLERIDALLASGDLDSIPREHEGHHRRAQRRFGGYLGGLAESFRNPHPRGFYVPGAESDHDPFLKPEMGRSDG